MAKQRRSSDSSALLLLPVFITLCLILTPLLAVVPIEGDGLAHAQQPNPRKARKAYSDAKRAYNAQKFDEAADLFKQAHGFDPKPQLLFNIGQALKEAGELAEAEQYYKRYLDEVPDADNREAVLETLFELQQLVAAQMAIVTIEANREGLNVFVDDEEEPRCQTPCIINVNPGPHSISVEGAQVERDTRDIEPTAQQELKLSFSPTVKGDTPGTLMVTTDVEGGVLMVDGKPSGRLPLGSPVSMAPGSYPLGVMIGGEVKWRGSVEIKPGELSRVKVELQDKIAEEGEGGGGALTTTAYVLWGVGVGALGAGALFGLSASSVESDLDAQLSRGEVPNQELIAQGESQSLNANIFFTAGAVAVGTGVLLYLLDDGGGEQKGPATGSVSPDVVPLEGGALIRIQTPF